MRTLWNLFVTATNLLVVVVCGGFVALLVFYELVKSVWGAL